MTLQETVDFAAHNAPNEEIVVDGDRREVQLWYIHEDGTRSLSMVDGWEA